MELYIQFNQCLQSRSRTSISTSHSLWEHMNLGWIIRGAGKKLCKERKKGYVLYLHKSIIRLCATVCSFHCCPCLCKRVPPSTTSKTMSTCFYTAILIPCLNLLLPWKLLKRCSSELIMQAAHLMHYVNWPIVIDQYCANKCCNSCGFLDYLKPKDDTRSFAPSALLNLLCKHMFLIVQATFFTTI